jgi:hypothetical protein
MHLTLFFSWKWLLIEEESENCEEITALLVIGTCRPNALGNSKGLFGV